ncbi:MAG TPA: hypothetical protein VHB98_10730, partial [Chloroflexota bacterium]|nr:hypothetical protein [Chloroflexota bacterium]
PYRDQEELEDLGTAAFLRLEPQATPAGYRGALFQINARGEPIEFTYNRVETPSTFLWRPADIQRAAARRLTASLLELAPRAPRLIFCLATEVPGDLFSRDLAVSMPICRIATSLQGNQEEEVAELIEGEEPLHLFWYPAPPEEGSPERLLAQTLALYGLLLEPFERASTALDELYGVKDPANA